MERELSRSEAAEMANAIRIVLATTDKYKPQFTHALVRNKHRLKSCVEEYSDSQKDFRNQQREAVSEFCAKDADGNPLTKDGMFVGITPRGICPKYDTRIDSIDETERAYYREKVKIDFYELKEEHIPTKELAANVEDAIYFMRTCTMDSKEDTDVSMV